MLDPYWGEFLVSPYPLELSLNSCSHGCSYCFANLNDTLDTEDPIRTLRLLADYPNRKTLAARLLQDGYPVLVSNRMDPFSRSNCQQIIPILRIMTEAGIPVTIQTKGGYGEDETLDFLPPSVWYVSLSMLDDTLRERIEPGAPSVQHRLDLMSRLADKGHIVLWGYNPMVPEWYPEPEPLVDAVVDAGAMGVWMELLHLNIRQRRNMSEWRKEALTQPIMKRAYKRDVDADMWDAIWRVYDAVEERELPWFSLHSPLPSDYPALERALYEKTFPMSQDFVNWCYANKDDGDLVSLGEWLGAVGQGLPDGSLKLQHYLGATAYQVFWTHKIPNDLTYHDLLKIMWADPRTPQCPARVRCFAFAGSPDAPELDDAGMPLLRFDRTWFDTLFEQGDAGTDWRWKAQPVGALVENTREG